MSDEEKVVCFRIERILGSSDKDLQRDFGIIPKTIPLKHSKAEYQRSIVILVYPDVMLRNNGEFSFAYPEHAKYFKFQYFEVPKKEFDNYLNKMKKWISVEWSIDNFKDESI